MGSVSLFRARVRLCHAAAPQFELLLGAPHFPDKPCLNLGRSRLQRWNGMLFDGVRDVHAVSGPGSCGDVQVGRIQRHDPLEELVD